MSQFYYINLLAYMMKTKDLQSPSITKRIKKSSKRKQLLYETLCKKGNRRNELEYKNYKTLFEVVKTRSKKSYLSKLTIKYKDNIKKTLEVIKKSIGKEKCSQ